jgi:hypothetical protein
MNTPGERQLEIAFGSDPAERGFAQWQGQRRQAKKELARRMGLPLEHQVEVWLRNGIRLRGNLRLSEEKLFIQEVNEASLSLLVDNVPFTSAEIESCVRLD